MIQRCLSPPPLPKFPQIWVMGCYPPLCPHLSSRARLPCPTSCWVRPRDVTAMLESIIVASIALPLELSRRKQMRWQDTCRAGCGGGEWWDRGGEGVGDLELSRVFMRPRRSSWKEMRVEQGVSIRLVPLLHIISQNPLPPSLSPPSLPLSSSAHLSRGVFMGNPWTNARMPSHIDGASQSWDHGDITRLLACTRNRD